MIGKKKINLLNSKCEYTGEIDKKGNATGFGVAVGVDDPDKKFEGTFFKNSIHGIGT